jgi:hypothetical protein
MVWLPVGGIKYSHYGPKRFWGKQFSDLLVYADPDKRVCTNPKALTRLGVPAPAAFPMNSNHSTQAGKNETPSSSQFVNCGLGEFGHESTCGPFWNRRSGCNPHNQVFGFHRHAFGSSQE